MSTNDPSVKQIQLTGEATEGFALMQSGGGSGGAGAAQVTTGGSRKRRGGGKAAARRTLRVGELTKEGGGSTSPGTLTQLAATRAPPPQPGAPLPPEPTGTDSKLTQEGAPVSTGGGKHPPFSGSHAPIKVVLAAKKKPAAKVILAAAKPAAPAAADRGKTRKSSARKVRVSMRSLSRKIDKAKKIRKHATEDSLATIKKVLHKAGLIKAESKAPEPILRQMYADFMTLKNRAL